MLPQDLLPEEDEYRHQPPGATPLVEQDYSFPPNLSEPPNTEYEEVTGAPNDGGEVEVEENSESLSNVEESQQVRSEPEVDEAPSSIVRQEGNPVNSHASVSHPAGVKVTSTGRVSKKPKYYGDETFLIRLAIVFHISLKKGIAKYGDRASEAATKELAQMVVYKVWSQITRKDLAKVNWASVINCFMFLKEKYKPDGTFDKLKMRLVAGGNGQERLDYDDVSSPTVLLTTVFIILAIVMMLEYFVVTADIAGAYLNARLKNKNLFMRIDPTLAAILVKLDSSYKDCLLSDGSLIVRLEKALYGCIESAKLWYELLAKTLMEYGLQKSSYDPCLFFDLSMEIYVTIYVDDLLIAAKSEERVRDLLKHLEIKFKTITVNEGSVISYL